MTIDVRIPNGEWLPRPHQENLWRYLEDGGKRAVAIWHRRAGKDEMCCISMRAAWLRPGNYWHCLPEYAMRARRYGTLSIRTPASVASMKRFPKRCAKRRANMICISALRTATWRCIGSDSYDRTVGSSAAGIVYSEYALCNPSAWAYHRPMLEENNGWAAFITTPRGRNHAYAMLNHARSTSGWFAEFLPRSIPGP